MKWYRELENYTREYGNPHVPRTHSNTKLASWVWIQRIRRDRPYGQASQLTQEQIALLDKLGFRWDAREEQWMEKFEKLKEFKIKYGHCEIGLIESEGSDLFPWITLQRSKLSRGELRPERKVMLDAIGFNWSSEVTDHKWKEMYEQLKKYHAENDNADVPHKWEGDPKLAAWVSYQRQRRKNNSLSDEQICLLDEVGFTWKSRDVGTWEDRLEDLAKFKAKHGHCDVPFEYPEIPKLGQFVNNTRNQRRDGKLSADRIAKLEALGFAWSSSKYRIGEDGMNAAWKSRFDELRHYKQTYGNCEVPSNWKENTPLANWVSAQRRLKKSGELHPERVKLLEEIGFTWELASPRQSWETRYAELLQFRKIHGNCDVPSNYPENMALGAWVYKQRQNKKSGKLSPEQEQLLNEAGFTWEKKPSRRT
jgi:hypothetical protein